MKVFTPANSKWDKKVNYVDKNNRVLGYSMEPDCCESFGHCILAELPTAKGDPSLCALQESILGPYSFSPDQPIELGLSDNEDGGMAGFRIVADALPDLWVVIWNFHSGYYSHGWEFDGKEGSL